MKRKTARELLAESFRELAASKPVDKITVPNIIENCGYSKTTFYRLFNDKYDLMAWDYNKSFQTALRFHIKDYGNHGFFPVLGGKL